MPPPREPSLADQVYDRLMRGVIEGVYPEDARLPSEAELAATCGVSRPVVRAALARLRDDGVVASRRGSGSYVIRRPSRSVMDFVPLGSITDIQRCYEFRIDVEGAAAGWAALRRTDADLSAIEAAHALMDARYAAGAKGVDADAALHLAIARASRNPFFAQVQEALAPQIAQGMTLSRSLSMLLSDARQRLLQSEHRAIIDAIAARDADRARAAMRAHIAAARDRMFEGDGGG